MEERLKVPYSGALDMQKQRKIIHPKYKTNMLLIQEATCAK